MRIEAGFPFGGTLKYNDVVRNVYDALFELNVECDFIPSDAPAERLAKATIITREAAVIAGTAWVDAVFLPRPIVFVDSLPRNATGKITAAAMAQLIATHLEQAP
mgnify:CR=1 FL=1